MNSLPRLRSLLLPVLLWLGLLWLGLLGVGSRAQEQGAGDFASHEARAAGLESEGNWAEALAIREAMLGDIGAGNEDRLGPVLEQALRDLGNLGDWNRADGIIEAALARHPQSLGLLVSAARTYGGLLPANGVILDGEFRRAPREGGGRWVDSSERDRMRSLQLWEQALARVSRQPEPEQARKLEVWRGFAAALLRGPGGGYGRGYSGGGHGGESWRLTRKTDWSVLPDWDQPVSGGWGDGWPVNAGGSVWFPALPQDFAAAANDGERWRWLMAQAAAVDADSRLQLALTWRNWLGVHTLGNAGIVPLGWAEEGERETRAQVLALHTLGDNQTSLQTAGGPQRLELPEDFRFLPQLLALGRDQALSGRQRNAAVGAAVAELLDRRQFERAAELLRGWIGEAPAAGLSEIEVNGLRWQLAGIVDARGSLDPLPLQPVDTAVKLSLVSRNAGSVVFQARRMNTARLLEDVVAYLRSEPAEFDYQRSDPMQVVRQLVEGGDAEKYLGPVEQQWTATLEPAPGHWDRRVTVDSPLAGAGAWWLEAEFVAPDGQPRGFAPEPIDPGNQHIPPSGVGSRVTQLVEISPLLLTSRTADHSQQFFVADARDGSAAVGAKLDLFGWNQEREYRERQAPLIRWNFAEAEVVTDPQGLASLREGDVKHQGANTQQQWYQWLIRVDGGDGRGEWLGWTGLNLQQTRGQQEAFRTHNLFLTSDRPVYRPGDTVHVAGWARNASYDPQADANPNAHQRCEVKILDGRGEEVLRTSKDADAWGGFDFELPLQDEATLGQYQVVVGFPNVDVPAVAGFGSFRVEEYRKPEFTVKVEAPERPVALGEKFEATVRADYLFGAPVREGVVKYTVTRTETDTTWYPPLPFDWLFGRGYGWRLNLPLWHPAAGRCWCILPPAPGPWSPWWVQPAPPEVIAQAEVPMGADGTVKIAVDTALAKELHGNRDHSYSITAEVTDGSRRTVTGASAVTAAREPFSVAVWTSASFYRPGYPVEVQVAARTPDGRPVRARGTLRVLQEGVDGQGQLVEQELEKVDFATDEEGNGSHPLSFEQPGQWRVEVELTASPNDMPTTDPNAAPPSGEPGPPVPLPEPRPMADDASVQADAAIVPPGPIPPVPPTSREPAEFDRPSTQLGTALVTVRGPETGRVGVAYEELTLTAERNEYAPGEEARLLIGSRFDNATVLVWKRPQNGVYPQPEVVKLDGRSGEISLALTRADQPNVFVEAQLIREGQVHRAVAQVFVPPIEQVMQVRVTPDAGSYLPRQEAKFTLELTGPDGRPLQGRLLLAGYDRALDGIAGELTAPDLREFYWGSKRGHQPQFEANALRQWYLHLAGNDARVAWSPLGVFGDSVGDEGFGQVASDRGLVGRGNGGPDDSRRDRAGGARMMMMAQDAAAPAPMAAAANAAPMDMVAQEKVAGEAAAPASALVQPTLRSEFADALLWRAFLETDSLGRAEFGATMPDDLTTWTIRAWVIGPRTEVGEATAEIVSRKDVMVRLATPRFLVETDRMVLSSTVHNELDEAQSLEVSLELEGQVLELTEGEATRRVRVPAHGEVRLDWTARALAQGEAVVRVKALGSTDSDAMERRFPVLIHGVERVESWSLAIRPGDAAENQRAELKISVPEALSPGSQRLQLRWSPTLAASMTEALPFLSQYPYGCIEQTLNRFVPTVVTNRVLRDMGLDLETIKQQRGSLNAGQLDSAHARAERVEDLREEEMPASWNPVFDNAEVEAMVRSGVASIAAQQRSDGGWSWLPGGRESSPYISAQVLAGLAAAQDAGATVPDEVVQRAVDYLRGHELAQIRRLELPEDHQQHKGRADDLDAFVHHALERRRGGDERMRAFLYRDRLTLSPLNQALLGLVCHERQDHQRRDQVIRNLSQFLHQDDENQTAWLGLPNNRRWWFWWNDEIETQAAYLRLLTATEPQGETTARVAKYLVNNRASGSHWKSTRDTAAAVLALGEFVKASGEGAPDLSYRVLLDGGELAAGKVDGANLFSEGLALDLDAAQLPPGEHTIVFERSGSSPLYGAAWLAYFSREDPIPAAGLEVEVERRYWRIVEEKVAVDVADANAQAVSQESLHERREPMEPGAEVPSGTQIEVELILKSRNDYEYLVFQDHKPAGAEAVSLLSGWVWDVGIPYYQEFRDEGAVIYIERLPRGETSLRYRLRAEAPGRFSALPTLGHAMYAPEIRANSAEGKINIGERPPVPAGPANDDPGL